MKKRITELLTLVESASQRPNAHWFIPYIIESLKAMLGSFSEGRLDPEALVREAGGLGRIVTDDFAFSESPLGQELLGFVSDIVSTYDSSWREV